MRYVLPILKDSSNTYIDNYTAIFEKNETLVDSFSLLLEYPDIQYDIPLTSFRKALNTVMKTTKLTVEISDTVCVYKPETDSVCIVIRTYNYNERGITLPIEAVSIVIDSILCD